MAASSLTDTEILLAFSFPEGVDVINRFGRERTDDMAGLSPFRTDAHDIERERIVSRFREGVRSIEEDRAIGSMLGLAVGDALGAPLEFSPVRYGSRELAGFDDVVWKKAGNNRFALAPGQWTDDTSMALCLADSLLVAHGFDARDLRLRFWNWWQFGYCNAFGFDAERADRRSVGLGGNIWESFEEFLRLKTEFTTAGDSRMSGNGSLMRNAPIAIFYHDNIAQAEAMSARQSKTTHQGEEAAECCRLLTHCIVQGIHGDGTARALERSSSEFRSDCYSVSCLAASEREEPHPDNHGHQLEDRSWNWRSTTFKYSPTRASEHPDYIGSYAMDALAMALHCVASTSTFAEAVLRCANLGGDSDSTAAITGQIAGAIYGARAIPQDWIDAVLQWDPHGDILLRAHKLFRQERGSFQPIRAQRRSS